MKAIELMRTRVVLSEATFMEIVLWRVPVPLPGSRHAFKYRLAYVVDGQCVLRYDNEAGKGDHRHVGDREEPYWFTTPERLLLDFQREIARWNDEKSDSGSSTA